MKPLISIIVPVYNVENYLVKCLESILSQTYQNLEILLVDDGSPDRCPQICDDYARKDSRIVVIHQKNLGVSAARNAGLDRATGEYIGFVDSDDLISPVMFENLLNLIMKYHVPISMCQYREIYDSQSILTDSKKETEKGVLSQEDAIKEILLPGQYNGYLCNKLFHQSLFNGITPIRFDPKISLCEDLLVVVQCFLKVQKVAYITQPFYKYQINLNSAMHNFSQKSLSVLNAWEKIFALLPLQSVVTAKAAYTNAISSLICRAYAANQKQFIPYLKTERIRYLLEFKREQKAFPIKDRIRVWGTGLLAPVFCRAWNIIKFIRVFLLRLKMISTKIV